jgi:hypothetical protein
LTPPRRQASICTTSIAPRMINCLNMMRFWHISPVATCIGLHGLADAPVALDVVGAGRLLDEPRLGEAQVPSHAIASSHHPHLVRVDHQLAVRAEHFARDAQAADVVVQVAADLELDVAKPASTASARAAQLPRR